MSEKISFTDEIVKAQKAAAAKDWECFKAIFSSNNNELLFEPLDLVKNTTIHAVARSGNKECLKELLEMLPDETKRLEALRKPNHEKNTPLHHVMFHDDPEMVKVIMEFVPRDKIEEFLELKNEQNETPGFRAARFGMLRVLKHLHANYGGLHSSRHFPPSNYGGRWRPILHTCVLHFNLGAAIWLLEKVDKNLAKEKFSVLKKNEEDNKKIVLELTCLKLLSKMPLAFESTDTLEMEMGLTERLVYELLLEDGYESELDDDAENNSVKVTSCCASEEEEILGRSTRMGHEHTT